MTDYAVGIDVSYFQHEMNWETAKSQGISFGIARVSYGTRVDAQFANNWKGMKSAGLVRGAYQFFKFDESAEEQANLMLETIKSNGGGSDFPFVIDIEKIDTTINGVKVTNGVDTTTFAERKTKLQTWLDIVEKGIGRKPMIYTSLYEWEKTINTSGFGAYPLWVAHQTTRSQPLLPLGWSEWVIWQYADKKVGAQYGAGSDSLDLDRFNGSVATLQNVSHKGSTTAKITPKEAHPSKSEPSAQTYTIQSGDSLYKIAEKYGTTVDVLVKLNAIDNPNLIRVGQELKLPAGAQAKADSEKSTTTHTKTHTEHSHTSEGTGELFDLTEYIMPSVQAHQYMMQDSSGPEEKYRPQPFKKGHLIQKNNEGEYYEADDHYIYLVWDTSPGNNQYYCRTKSSSDSSHAPYLPRHMRIGQSWTADSTHYVKFYNSSDCSDAHSSSTGSTGQVAKLVKHHPTMTTPNGGVAKDVIEIYTNIAWNDTAGEETQFYAKGFGRIGWTSPRGSAWLTGENINNQGAPSLNLPPCLR
ncbi:MAG: GH25 family lysozyme [Chloroflexota bacterium]